jgi:hypothetical protein
MNGHALDYGAKVQGGVSKEGVTTEVAVGYDGIELSENGSISGEVELEDILNDPSFEVVPLDYTYSGDTYAITVGPKIEKDAEEELVGGHVGVGTYVGGLDLGIDFAAYKGTIDDGNIDKTVDDVKEIIFFIGKEFDNGVIAEAEYKKKYYNIDGIQERESEEIEFELSKSISNNIDFYSKVNHTTDRFPASGPERELSFESGFKIYFSRSSGR